MHVRLPDGMGTRSAPPVSIDLDRIAVGGAVGNIGLHLESCFGSCELPLDSRSEELDLVDGLRTGKEQAYEALIQHYQQPVYNLVFRLLNDPADANDVVQEVFFKVFRNIACVSGPEQPEDLGLPNCRE